MKDSGAMDGGNYQSQNNAALAQYFVKFIQAYEQRGIPIWAITPQNEPLYGNGNYPTTSMSADQEADFIGNFLGPALTQAGLSKTLIIGYDHNWDATDYPLQLLGNAGASAYLAGNGLSPARSTREIHLRKSTVVNRHFRNKGIWFTEATPVILGTSFSDELNQFSTKLIVGNFRNWGRSMVIWNLALDSQGNPHLNGCGVCTGVISIDNGKITQNAEYATLEQVAKVVEPGAIRH